MSDSLNSRQPSFNSELENQFEEICLDDIDLLERATSLGILGFGCGCGPYNLGAYCG